MYASKWLASERRGQSVVPRADVLLVAAGAALLFLPGLGNRALWNPDEPRYAEVAREMRASREYLVPHLNGEVYVQKPPLLFWSIAASAGVTGELDEAAARLPSALAAIGTVLLTFSLARRLFNRRAAWFAAAALATSGKILWQARSGQIDMLLTFLVTLGVYFWARGYWEGRPGLYPLFFAATGLATLAKGPAGFLPPLLGILAFLALAGERGELRRFADWKGFALWAGIVLAWLLPAAAVAGADYLETLVVRQNVHRMVVPGRDPLLVGHLKPWYYLWTVIPADYLPWSFFLPSVVVVGWRALRGELRRGFAFALSWAVVTVAFFSLSPAKRSVYVLTMYPAMALLVGIGLDRLAAGWPRRRGWLVRPTGLLVFAGLLATGIVPALAHRREEIAVLGPGVALAMGLGLAAFTLAAVTALGLGRRGRVAGAVGAVAAGSAAIGMLAALYVLPAFDPIKDARPLARVLVESTAPGEPYGIYPGLDPPFLFYTGRYAVELPSPRALAEFVRRPGVAWVLAERDDLARLDIALPLEEVARDRDPKEGYLLLRERGAASPPAPDRRPTEEPAALGVTPDDRAPTGRETARVTRSPGSPAP